MAVHSSILELIGNTPMVDVSQLSPNPKVRILAKLEGQNPGGSIKDRIAWQMVQEAEADGTLRAFSVQYHPEAAAGPHDAAYLFDRFADLMQTRTPEGAPA